TRATSGTRSAAESTPKAPLTAQLDFTATPRYHKGGLFPWTFFDYPLKQAITPRCARAAHVDKWRAAVRRTLLRRSDNRGAQSQGTGHRPRAGSVTQELLRRDDAQRRPAAKVGGVPGDERRRSRPAALGGGEHQRVPELHSPSQASGDVVCLEVEASRLRPHPHPIELAEATSEPRRLLHGGMKRHRASDLEHGDDGCHPLPRGPYTLQEAARQSRARVLREREVDDERARVDEDKPRIHALNSS